MGPLGPVLRGYSAERKELQENLVGISLGTDRVRAPRTWTLVLEGRATMSIALDREGGGGSGSFQDPTQGGVEAGLELLPGRPWSSGPPRSKPTSGVQMAGGWVFTWPLHPGDTSYRIHTWGTPTSVSYHLARLSLAPQGLPPRPSSQPGQTPLCFSHRLRPRGSLWLAASLPSRLQVTTQQTVRAEARIPPLNIPLIQTRRKLPSSVWGGSGSHDAVHRMRSVSTALGPEQTRGILDSLGWKGS